MHDWWVAMFQYLFIFLSPSRPPLSLSLSTLIYYIRNCRFRYRAFDFQTVSKCWSNFLVTKLASPSHCLPLILSLSFSLIPSLSLPLWTFVLCCSFSSLIWIWIFIRIAFKFSTIPYTSSACNSQLSVYKWMDQVFVLDVHPFHLPPISLHSRFFFKSFSFFARVCRVNIRLRKPSLRSKSLLLLLILAGFSQFSSLCAVVSIGDCN